MPLHRRIVYLLSSWYIVALLAVASHAGASDQTIGTDPLQITVADDLSVTVQRDDAQNQVFDPQYYSTYQTYLILTNPTTGIHNYSSSDDDFIAVSNSATAGSISTSVTADSNISLVQTVQYIDGTQLIKHTWQIANSANSTITYPSMTLRYGGDTHFHNNDFGVGYYLPSYASGALVSCAIPGTTGLMGMYADPTTPANYFAEDVYTLIDGDLDLPNASDLTPAHLSDTVNPTYVDNAMGLEWNTGTLAPGARMTYVAYEIWDAAAQLNCIAPPAQNAYCATPTALTFTLTNTEGQPDTFAIQPLVSPGITVDQVMEGSTVSSAPVSLGVNQSISITITISGSVGLAGTQGMLSLFAVSTATPAILQQGVTALTFIPAVVVSPSIATATVYAGAQTPLSFTVTNNESVSDTFTLQLAPSAGITISNVSPPIAPLVLTAGASATCSLVATADASLVGGSGTVSLSATSTTNPSFTDMATTQLSVLSAVTVTAPTVSSAQAVNAPLSYTFTITNTETGSDTFSVGVIASSGLSVTGVQIQGGISTSGSNVTIASDGSAQATVTAIAASALSGGTGSISLSASSITWTGAGAQANLPLTFAVATVTPPATTTLPAPTIPISGSQIFYVPVCPSTTQGIASLVSAFTTVDSTQAVAFAWDALAQSYTQLPTQPSGGLQTDSGVFIASAVPLSMDFSGTATPAPISLVLEPGWNLLGVPPLDPGNGSPVITAHPFPSGFNLLDHTGAVVLSQSIFIDTLGTPGNPSLSTAEPFLFQNGGYAQVAVMQSGTAYWIKNNTASSVTLQRVLSGVVLSVHRNSQSAAAAVAGQYADRGSPPVPPSGGGMADAPGHSTGGCGAGSGSSVLLLPLLAWRRRDKRGALHQPG